MRTLSNQALPGAQQAPQAFSEQSTIRRVARGLGFVVIRIVVGLVVALSLLPVILLPIATAVPLYVWLAVMAVDTGLLYFLIRHADTWLANLLTVGGLIAISVLAVLASQWYAMTPPIVDETGRPLPNSIATLETVTLGDSEQWVTIRGRDVNNPVLLFLAGGPGGSQLTTARHELAALEEDFVVVNWEQPGAGKSFNAVDRSTLTPARYIEDGHALVNHLRQRFGQEKVYVVGESWGSALGVMMAQRYPEDFHALIGTAQMVDFLETDLICYDFALELAATRGDTQQIEQLRAQGPPPYYGDGVAWKQIRYLKDTYAYMDRDPSIIGGYNTPRDLASPEYGLIDKINWARGPLETLGIVYPYLWDVDFREDAPKLDVPVYFLIGRHDVNAPPALVEEYYELLDAPHKELIWFEHSGHGPWTSEPEKFVDVLVNRVLPQTAPQTETRTETSTDAQTKPQSVASPAGMSVGVGTDAETAAFFDALMPSVLEDYHIAGSAVAVVKEGELHFAQGYGMADLAKAEPVVAERTLFRTDSTGKLFVWTAVMQLVEQGQLDLDADINTYLDFQIPATYDQPITLRHLMSHSAGFEDQAYMFAHAQDELTTSGSFLAEQMPARVRPPGQLSAYSNYGTALAGYIVERVAGEPFEAVVEENIFAPLGMAHSTFRQPLPATLADRATQNYRYANGDFDPHPFIYLDVPAAGEGHMTVTDMAQFMLAHLSDAATPILGQATLDQMHSRLFSHHPDLNGFAYGFAETTINQQRLLRHEGNNPGVSSSALYLLPEHQVGVYVTFNSNGGFGPGEAVRTAFMNHFYPAQPTPPTAVTLTPAERTQIEGSYRSTRMFETTFGKVIRLLGPAGGYGDIVLRSEADGTFTTQGLGTSPQRWVPVSAEELQLADGALDSFGSLRFDADARGEITTLWVENNPYRAYEKVSWTETVGLHRMLLGLFVGTFALLLLGAVPVGLLLQRRPALASVTDNTAAWVLLLSAALLNLIFLVGLFVTLEESLVFGVTELLYGLLALPLLAIVLAIVSLWLVLRGNAIDSWQMVTLLPYSAGLMAVFGFSWWLNQWNLLGWRL